MKNPCIWMSVCCLFLDEQDTFFAVILLSEIKFSLGSHTMYFRFGLSSLATYTNNSALKRGVYGTYMERGFQSTVPYTFIDAAFVITYSMNENFTNSRWKAV